MDQSLPAWTADYVGRPYHPGGKGPLAYSCWGLTVALMRDRFSVTLPDVPEPLAPDVQAAALTDGARGPDWRRLDPQGLVRPGDVVLMRRPVAGRWWPAHVGVIVGPSWLLHAVEGAGVVAQPMAAIARRIVGIWRHRDREIVG